MRKTEIKQLAIDRGYSELANKSESYEICFVPDNDYRGFLKRRVEGLEERVEGGNFVLADGTVLGQHKGYPFYTVGQRKGLELAMGEPMHVLEIVPETNTVILGTKDELEKQEMLVRNFNLIKYAELSDPFEALTKIRYKDPGAMSTLSMEGGQIKVLFHTKVSAIAPGQSAVFYEGNDLIGGGFITRKVKASEKKTSV
jgi:tRNA-specific 2-thiouridylase